jgi:hypothetical protein
MGWRIRRQFRRRLWRLWRWQLRRWWSEWKLVERSSGLRIEDKYDDGAEFTDR